MKTSSFFPAIVIVDIQRKCQDPLSSSSSSRHILSPSLFTVEDNDVNQQAVRFLFQIFTSEDFTSEKPSISNEDLKAELENDPKSSNKIC